MDKIQVVGSIPEFMAAGREVKTKEISTFSALSGAVLMTTGTDTFTNVHVALMNAFDAGVVLVIVFAGACWCLGHRPKALEIIIGVSAGYVLARHAIDIRDFLKGI